MSDVPAPLYASDETATIDRQIIQATQAGITGFISSWWGQGSPTDLNFARLLARSAAFAARKGTRLTSTIYLESQALGSPDTIARNLAYFLRSYGHNPYLFRWHGKIVVFIWNAMGGGRTLADWQRIRASVDPLHHTIWSVEGTDPALLSVFDGLHLYSAGYWGLQDGTMPAVDQGFRAKIDAFNAAHHGTAIWAAGVLPGYDDRRVPGRTGTYVIARNNGATYRTSWNAAISSNPDWVTITSFNEWFEGSAIEPGVHSGTLYLSLTRQFAGQWRGG
jgi:hypothetical protein